MAQYLDMQQRISTAVNMPAYKDERKSVGEQTLLTTKIQLTEQKSIKSAMTNGEFRLHYQPIVELSSGKIIGCEALVRWPDIEGNLILPL